jgi:FKBP-type peptidyl-prolyl cis-trans isomerase FklB
MKRDIVKDQNRNKFTGIVLVAVSLCLANTVYAADAKKPKTLVEKFSYAVGVKIGQGLKRDGAEVDVSIVSQAIRDVTGNKKLALSGQEMQEAVKSFQEKAMAKRDAKGSTAKKAGEKFLLENKKKAGITVLDNGIQYKVVKKGKGKKPKKTDSVVAHYKGMLISGKVFDSSYDRKKPATFGLTNVIKGWQEILPKMSIGAKWKVFIPSDLAYGSRGAGGTIGPGETLIFDIELIDIK